MILTRPDVLPDVDDVALSASMTVVVKNDVTVSTTELPMCRGVNRNFVRTLNSPDLKTQDVTFTNNSQLTFTGDSSYFQISAKLKLQKYSLNLLCVDRYMQGVVRPRFFYPYLRINHQRIKTTYIN